MYVGHDWPNKIIICFICVFNLNKTLRILLIYIYLYYIFNYKIKNLKSSLQNKYKYIIYIQEKVCTK